MDDVQSHCLRLLLVAFFLFLFCKHESIEINEYRYLLAPLSHEEQVRGGRSTVSRPTEVADGKDIISTTIQTNQSGSDRSHGKSIPQNIPEARMALKFDAGLNLEAGVADNTISNTSQHGNHSSIVGANSNNNASLTTTGDAYNCRWFRKKRGALEWDVNENQEFMKLISPQKNDEFHESVKGRRILLLGGSTTRDLAADCMAMVSSPQVSRYIYGKWREANVAGYQLFPGSFKENATDGFDRLYDSRVMDPLVQTGWKFQSLVGKGDDAAIYGCGECYSNQTELDHVATLSPHNISVEYTWKPDIYAPISDPTAFEQRYCRQHYDVVHIGRGLHDVAFAALEDLTPTEIRKRFLLLAEWINKCFDSTTLVIIRQPYASRQRKPDRVENQMLGENVTVVIEELVQEGAFGADRTLLVDAYWLTSAPSHPKPYDGHHYDAVVSKTYWELVRYVVVHFFQNNSTLPETVKNGKFKGCALGTTVL